MPDKDEVARRLAQAHYEVEPGITHIYRIQGKAKAETDPAEPIKLLEVSESTVASGILPLAFGALPDCGIPYPSVIVEVTPEEYARLRARQLKLPRGWRIGPLLPKAGADGAGK